MGGVATQVLSRSDAERLTEKLRHTATTFVEARDKLTELIRQAQEGKAHEALGFRSWTEYVAQVFSDTPLMRLTREERRELVGELAEQGMSTRAIAPVVGASHMTVQRDIDSTVTNVPVETLGVNGKTYQRPEPRPEPSGNFWTEPDEPSKPSEPAKPKRTSIIETTKTIGVEIFNINERLEKLFADDRYTKNEEEIQAILKPYFSLIQKTINN